MKVVKLEGKCDVTRYKVALLEDEEIKTVQYRDMSVPKPYGTSPVTSALTSYRVQPNATLFRAGEPIALAPDSVVAAFWFVRACYEMTRRPAFYYYAPEQTLCVFPAPSNDGDLLLISIKQSDKQFEPVSQPLTIDVEPTERQTTPQLD